MMCANSATGWENSRALFLIRILDYLNVIYLSNWDEERETLRKVSVFPRRRHLLKLAIPVSLPNDQEPTKITTPYGN